MSTTSSLSVRSTPGRRRGARTAAVIATLAAATAVVGAGGAPAAAAPTHLPIVMLTNATAPSSVTLRSVWAALIALPGSNPAHDAQIMKELATVGTD